MILRRFMEHVNDQNWFAVGLDVCVVVVGIFLGMQVTDWNEDRKQQATELEFLKLVRDELSEQLEQQQSELEVRNDLLKSIYVSLAILEKGELLPGDRVAFEHGIEVTGTGLTFTTIDHLPRSLSDQQALARISSENLRKEVLDFEKFAGVMQKRDEGSISIAIELFLDITRMVTWKAAEPDRLKDVAVVSWYDFDELIKDRALYKRLTIFYGSLQLRTERLKTAIDRTRHLRDAFAAEIESRQA